MQKLVFCVSVVLMMLLNLSLNRGCYFQVNSTLRIGMSIQTAFRTALETWSSWIDTKINRNRTRVFFRTFEPSHWRYLLIAMPSIQMNAFGSLSRKFLQIGAGNNWMDLLNISFDISRFKAILLKSRKFV